MSEWTSKYAIMRDLAVAQGFDVPADLEGIGANEKPPTLNIPEDNGEDYFEHGAGEGDCAEPPDLALIQHMLAMVRDVPMAHDEISPEHVVQISKPSKLNIGVDITHTKTGTVKKTIQNKQVTPQPVKVKKKRENVAVNSILLALADDLPILNMETPKEPLKLLKPNDFISEDIETEVVQSVEKVNEWLDKQVPSSVKSVEKVSEWLDKQVPSTVQSNDKVNGWLDKQVPSTQILRFSDNPLLLQPGSMFKRKSSLTVKSPESNSVKLSSPQKKCIATTLSNKSTVLCDAQEVGSSKTKPSGFPLALDAGSMFKRKNGSTTKSIDSDSVKSSPQQVATIGLYKPSGLASEYLQKYVERSKMKEMVQEDVWSRAERKMKEIDERKKLEAETAAKNAAHLLESATNLIDMDTADLDAILKDQAAVDITNGEATTDMSRETKIPDAMEFLQNGQTSSRHDSPCWIWKLRPPRADDAARHSQLVAAAQCNPAETSSLSARACIELPQHRHLLTGECVVCQVVKAHGYDVDAEIYGNVK